jgi:hypothetical protein
MRFRALTALAIAAIGVLTMGCGGFDRVWDEAGELTTRAQQEGDPQGQWEGRWQSHANGHAGDLRAIIRRVGPGVYDAQFKAWWGGLFSGAYNLTLRQKPGEGPMTCEGRSDLGWPWGEYAYEMRMSPDALDADYRSDSDQGVFVLQRPRSP